ncbi:MAG: metallophosphoesterase, partial [Desulfobacteraceae bacterium]|nr:metallophosphoesterase [Desulfobacteraceae bacterium]
MFGTILILISTFIHAYVFWRVASVPFVRQHVSRKILIGTGVVLWAGFCFGRILGQNVTIEFAVAIEFFRMNWMAGLFLIFISLLLMDIVTVFGFLMPRFSPSLRGLALIVGVALSMIALFQGLRVPVIREYEVRLSNLPNAMDRTMLVVMADMHLGKFIGEDWLIARIAQVKELQPDIIVVLGDIFEGRGSSEDHLVAAFKKLSAPLGIWAVTGNHEYHKGVKSDLMEKSGFRVLNNKWAEVRPGFVLSGVDDLTTWYRKGEEGDPVSQALLGRPVGATIFLSHTPWKAEKVSKAGVGLMLSGHTHGG